jgi:hypothetical protein
MPPAFKSLKADQVKDLALSNPGVTVWGDTRTPAPTAPAPQRSHRISCNSTRPHVTAPPAPNVSRGAELGGGWWSGVTLLAAERLAKWFFKMCILCLQQRCHVPSPAACAHPTGAQSDCAPAHLPGAAGASSGLQWRDCRRTFIARDVRTSGRAENISYLFFACHLRLSLSPQAHQPQWRGSRQQSLLSPCLVSSQSPQQVRARLCVGTAIHNCAPLVGRTLQLSAGHPGATAAYTAPASRNSVLYARSACA